MGQVKEQLLDACEAVVDKAYDIETMRSCPLDRDELVDRLMALVVSDDRSWIPWEVLALVRENPVLARYIHTVIEETGGAQ